ncbi:PREDICTED: CD2 antigen cytoplasmic tail-binding protein 2-like [Amphimedon queenslandica]|nr:PREDICTED: CD2 antigen cytoplasmic tail-binding protein 2-like [Amphimedon queenslandica]|eukprot:XP_003383440.1 PREDICTED: CD2 antigen cytoplasmic tail-binding protein 2-like [Amphimedon queenslandica]
MASKREKRQRKVAFAEEVDIPDKKSKETDFTHQTEERKSRFKAKHSLDSDEEDDIDTIQQSGLDDEDLGAQEETTIANDGDIKLTPFNLEEEMEDGYFDAHGNYYEKADPNAIQDTWLEGVDWAKIEEQRQWKEGAMAASDKDEEGDAEEVVDKVAIYQQILNILKPGETVVKALARLGSSRSMSASERLKQKKKKKSTGETTETDKSSADKEEERKNVDALTGCADQLVAIGDYSVYEDTYEKIKYKLHKEEEARKPVDMFSDDVPSTSKGETSSGPPPLSDEVMWEYRLKNEEDEEIHGPFSSTQMKEWTENDHFPEGVWVRKANSANAQFYSSKRIDFDLYS